MDDLKILAAGTLLSAITVIGPTGCAGRSGRAVPVPPAPPARAVPATVAYVIDGDTIITIPRARPHERASRRVLAYPGAPRVRVRLLGLDAPEDTRRHGCFGAQATAAL